MSTSPKNLPLFPDSAIDSSVDPFFFENLAGKAGFRAIAGVDEAGRGPLAGPVVGAAVIIPAGVELPGVRDSKKMTAKAREEALVRIQTEALAAAVGVVSHQDIDELNILQASLEAMRRAVDGLRHPTEFLLVDGNQPVPAAQPQRCIPKGDRLSRSISAASVLAKVYRDRIMSSYHRQYPCYGFDRNKGYGTREHLAALARYGACPVHRRSFKGVNEQPALSSRPMGPGGFGEKRK